MKKISLRWMDMIRDARDLGKTPEQILDIIFTYGLSEEKRIVNAFEEEFSRI